MRLIPFFVNSLLILASSHDSEARLIGTRRWSTSNEVSSAATNNAEAVPAMSKDNDTMPGQRPENKSILTGTLFATFFNVEDENSDDECYDCCCDRDVVCNAHGKSEATCQENGCNNGATCESKGYTCPSYDCETSKS
ncbi:hypothetical protein IV203_027972 [Nitzschia inconspicua]|uniref:Uncharacterized protein n=1 Tax=Nitzschia inconspicua TaxID=303405 RepID=A0A9K3Q4C5_9STRA|nr:hypothetical protein IV203_027972 [Nitzschia inconspicua]